MENKDGVIGEIQQDTSSAPVGDYLQRAFLMSVFQKMPKPLYDGDGYVSYEEVGAGFVSIHVEIQKDIGDVHYSKLALLRLMVKAIVSLLMQSRSPDALRRFLRSLWTGSAAITCPECYAGGGWEPGACEGCGAREGCRETVLLP